MADSRTNAIGSARVIDTLNSLLEANENSFIRFMGEGSPYLSRATAEVRKPLSEIVEAGNRRVMQLAGQIDALGGVPAPPTVQREEQYLAFLTLKFLLPKIIGAKKLLIERYENALQALQGAPSEAIDLVESQLAEHREELEALTAASSHATVRAH